MRHSARTLLALALVLPGPSWAQPIRAPAIRAPSSAAPAAGAPAPVPSAPPALFPSPSAPNLAPPLPAAAPGPRASVAPEPASAAALPVGRAAASAETAEDGSFRASRFFDQAAAYEHLGREAPEALPEEAVHALRAVHTPAPETAGDDGGGPDYPSRKVKFNGLELPSVAFRPNTSVEALLVEAVNASKKTIALALYEFSSRAVFKALQQAKRRGVKVQVVVDDSNFFPRNEPGTDYRRRRSEQLWGLVRDGFDVRVLRGVTKYGINHNKFAVFDGKLAEFGSYNWSFTAEHNHYENVHFSAERARVAALSRYWKYLWHQAVPHDRAKDHDWPAAVPAPPAEAAPSVAFNGVKLPAYVFSPGDALEDALVSAIDAARTSVDYAMFAPRSTKVAEALKRAASRGVKVRALIDESQSRSEHFKPYAEWLALHDVEVKTLSGPNGADGDFPLAEKMHHKFMVLDGKLAQTGSANHTKRASMDNYENAHFLNDKTDVAAYAFAFRHMFAIAAALPRPQSAAIPTDEQLKRDIESPPDPAPPPPAPPQVPLPAAETLTFNGTALPVSAFRPYEPVERHVVAAIDAAKKTVRIAIYQFEQRAILDALQRAKARGVKVSVVIDRGHVYTTGISHEGGPRKPRPMVVELVKSGFDLLLLKGQASGIMHNKFMIADGKLLQAGSYNYTEQSETDHFENVFFTDDKARVRHYLRYFEYMNRHGEAVDFDKLEDILRFGFVADRDSKFPPPPADAESPVRLNGESFPRQMFSPQGGIEEALVRAIRAAQKSVDIAMFSFYSRTIADALLAAKNRGVKVRLLLDKSQTSLSKLDDWFSWHGFEIKLSLGPDDARDPLYQKMHNKFAVFDGKMVETGSFNYSPNAEKNSFENSNFFDLPALASRYAAFFERLFQHGFKAPKPRREPTWMISPSGGEA